MIPKECKRLAEVDVDRESAVKRDWSENAVLHVPDLALSGAADGILAPSA